MERLLRHSYQRDKIYDYLCSTKLHPTAEDIYLDLKIQIQNLSLATVYRNLKVLEEIGKIRRVSCDLNSERYDADCSKHIHFICRKCGLVEDVHTNVIKDIKEVLQETIMDNMIEDIDLSIKGVCAKCVKTKN